MKTCFHSHFYANFHGSVTAIFVLVFMKFSPKCRTKKFGMIYSILGNFCLFVNWEGADIRPQIRLRKIPVVHLNIQTDRQTDLSKPTEHRSDCSRPGCTLFGIASKPFFISYQTVKWTLCKFWIYKYGIN